MVIGERPFLILMLLFFGLAKLVLAAAPVECVQQILGTDVAVSHSRELARQWMEKRGKLDETLTNPWPEEARRRGVERTHPEDWEVRGIPAQARLVPGGQRIWRQYVADKATLETIKQTQALIGGPVPYIQVAPHLYKKRFEDVAGAFLTTPDASPYAVGLSRAKSEYSYIDLKLADDLPVVELEPGHIYVIPLPKNHFQWVREAYRKYKAGEPVDPTYRKMCESIDRDGGLFPAMAIPIEIVGEGVYQGR